MSNAAKTIQYSASREYALRQINNLFENMQADLDFLSQKNAKANSFIRALADGDYDDINEVIARAQILTGDA